MTSLPVDSDAAVELRDYWRILRQRRRVIFLSVLACLAAALIYIATADRVYESTARLLIEDGSRTYTRSDPSQPFGDVLSLPGHDVLTQVEVLRGDDLLHQALRKADVPAGAVTTDIARVFDTDVVSVSVRSSNPAYAQRVADMLPRVFMAYGVAMSHDDVAGAARFARSRLAVENNRLANAEIALQKFRDREGITDLEAQRTAGITAARAADADVLGLQKDVQGLSAQLASLRAYRGSLPAVSKVPKTVTNPNLTALRGRIAALQNDRAKLIILYKPNNTRVQELDAQIASLRKQLAGEPPTVTTVTTSPNTVAGAYDQQIADLRANLASKRNELNAARAAQRALNKDLTRYAALQRQEAALQRKVDRSQSASAMLATNAELLGIREQASRSPASLVSAAGPAHLVAPRIPSALAAALLAGLFLGIAAALLTNHLDERVYSEADARRLLGSPVLGLIPRATPALTGAAGARPGSASPAVYESFRVLRANLQLSTPERPARSLLVTSTMAAEGKSYTAMNLAKAMARDGQRVILVDADLRSPTLHERLETPAHPGLADVLRGHADLKEALHPTRVPGLRVMPAGSDPGGAVETLTTASAETLARELSGMGDCAVFDGPPLLEAAESLVLSGQVDGVLYVVEVGGPPKPMLTLAEQMLSNAHARVVGVVLNRVDPVGLGYGAYRRRDGYEDSLKESDDALPAAGLAAPVPAIAADEEEV